jgi:hypothetical protein
MLAQLLAWAILDQERLPKSTGISTGAVHTRPGTRRYAHYVGNYALALLLDRKLSGKIGEHDRVLMAMLRLFRARGGFRVYVMAEKGLHIYNRAQRARRELHYVYWIVDYLCRYKKYFGGTHKFNIETAKQFLEQCAPEGKASYGESKIEKIWLNYKDSAPYIFAFYPFLSRALKQEGGSPEQVLYFIEKLASNKERLIRLLGMAAYAADILDGLAHDVRINDFKNIERVEPLTRPFTSFEFAMINNIDRKAPIG